jgi:tetratricopeptide (TPR) repeat protein
VRLVTVSRRGGEDRVDLVHEALLRRWATFRDWIEASRKAMEREEDLEAAAKGWEAAGAHEDGLPGPAQLAYLGKVGTASPRARRFLEAASALERRRAVERESARRLLEDQRNEAMWQRALAERRLTDANAMVDHLLSTVDEKLERIEGTSAVRKELLERTAELQERLLGGAGDSKEALRIRAINHRRRGDLARTHDNLTVARKEHEAGLAIALRLVEREPGNASFGHELSRSYRSLGDVAQVGGDLAATRGYFEKGLELVKALTEADPQNAALRRDLSVSYTKLGDVAQAGGDLAAARGYFEKGLELDKALTEADPQNAHGQLDLVHSHGRLASLARRRKDTVAFRAHWDAAVAVLDRLQREGRAQALAQVAKLRAWLDGMGP